MNVGKVGAVRDCALTVVIFPQTFSVHDLITVDLTASK